jgi:hypothetical protein
MTRDELKAAEDMYAVLTELCEQISRDYGESEVIADAMTKASKIMREAREKQAQDDERIAHDFSELEKRMELERRVGERRRRA